VETCGGRQVRSAVIRVASAEDAVALGTIQAASHQATCVGIMPDSVLSNLTAERLIERFQSRLSGTAEAGAEAAAPSAHRLWVIEADGAIAGYAATQPGASTFLPPPDGAGEIDPLVLWAFAANAPARRFYERAGWVLDRAGENWILGGIACPIVRYRSTPARR
jgi:hypothetical protein